MQNSILEGSDLARIARHGTVYFIASVLTKGLHAILLPVYTHWLTPDQYAVFSNLYAIASLIVVGTSLYMDNAYARFYFDSCDDIRKLRTLFSTLLIFMSAWGILGASAAFFLLSKPLAQTYDVTPVPYVLLICIIPLFMQFNALAATHFRTQHRSTLATSATYLLSVVNAGVAIVLLVGFGAKAQALLWGVLAGEAASAALLIRWLVREGILGPAFDLKQLRSSICYSIGLLPLTAASWLSGYSDRLLITWLGTLNASGVYSVAFEIGRVINIIVLAIFMVYGPMMFALLKDGTKETLVRIERFQSFYIHILIGSAFFLSLFATDIYAIFVGSQYHQGAAWVPIIASAFVFGGLRKLYATPIYYHKLTWLISLGGVAQAGVNFLINYWLIPHYGPVTAAWSKLISMALVALYFNRLCAVYQPIKLDRDALRVTILTFAGCLGAYLVAAHALQLHGYALFASKLAILMAATIVTWRSRFGRALTMLTDAVSARLRAPRNL